MLLDKIHILRSFLFGYEELRAIVTYVITNEGHRRVTSSVLNATCVLLFYDYICTLDREIEYMWFKPRLSFGMLAFVCNRYLPFIYSMLAMVFSQPLNQSVQGYWPVVWVLQNELVLLLRTCAIWERKHRITIPLTIVYVILCVSCVISLNMFTKSKQYSSLPTASCEVVSRKQGVIWAYLTVVAFESLVAFLTILRAVKYPVLQRPGSMWIHELYRQGLACYCLMIGIITINIVFTVYAPVALQNLFSETVAVLHSMCANRILFLIFRQRTERIAEAELETGTLPEYLSVYTTM